MCGHTTTAAGQILTAQKLCEGIILKHNFHNLRHFVGRDSVVILVKLPDHMVDDDGLWRHQECMQALRDLRELHSLGLKDLQNQVNS